MKHLALAGLLAVTPLSAMADGFVLGSGRWVCGDVMRISQSGTPIEKGQLYGWIFGYWSAATFDRETRFGDIVENVGAEKIANATFGECGKAPPDTPLYKVVQEIIRNTK